MHPVDLLLFGGLGAAFAQDALQALDYSTFIGGTMEYRMAAIVSDPAGNTLVKGSRMFDLAKVNGVLAKSWPCGAAGDLL